MKKFIYPIIMLFFITIFLILTPREKNIISAYEDTDSHLLVPQKNVVIVTLNLEANSMNMTNPQNIIQLRRLNDEFKGIEGVNRIDSILNATVISSSLDDIEVKSFLPDFISNESLQEQIKKISEYPELKPYISSDGKSLLYYIYFGYNIMPVKILENLEKIEGNSKLIFSYTGRSPILAITERLLSNDILIFIPLLFVIIMVIFFSFRSTKAISISWIIIILSVSLSYSIIVFSGIKLSPLILLVPVFALGLLSDYLIHYMYHLLYEPNYINQFIVRRNLIYPLSLTALSTLTGFLSLIYINASGHTLLGGIVGLSVLFTFIGVILWLPYMKFKRPVKNLLPRFSHYQSVFFDFLYKYRKLLYFLISIGVIWGITELPKLKIEPYPVEQLPENSTIKKAEETINTDFYGALPFFIEIDGTYSNCFLEKNTLIELDKIHNILNNTNEIGYSYSLLTVLKRINFYFFGDENSLLTGTEYDESYSALVEQYLLYYTSGVDPLEYESMIDPSYRFFSIKGYVKYKNVESLNEFYKTIDLVKENLPEGWKLTVSGVISDLNSEKNGLTKNWIFSFTVGSLLIFITVLFFYKKLKLAFLSLIPGFISMILSFGIISVMGVTIDSFSIIFVAIITGLVIDYSIHTLSALDKIESILTVSEGFKYINSYSGIPIFLSFLTSLFSFSVLFLSSFKGARNLGILLFASLIISYILSLFLLPIIILPSKIKKEK